MSMQVASDFRSECKRTEALVAPLDEIEFVRPTGFKGWSINMILRHLHTWDRAAHLSLTDTAAFDNYLAQVMPMAERNELPKFEERFLNGSSGRELFDAWRGFYPKLADAFAVADPKKRLPWTGPSMSARSSMTARLMEAWSHSQAIYDELGIDRESSDGIQNIVVLGHNTYGWTFHNRGLEPPSPHPQLRLSAPSGAEWKLGEGAGNELITGAAEEFCQVVTQTRNIADTKLQVEGKNATEWMRIAQCFAGPANDPPAPGTRRKKSN